jgi:hypothetical protein
MKKDEVLKVLETAKGDESFIVRTEAEEKTFLENFGKQIEEEKIPSKISELHNRYDEDVFSVTGMKKNPTEKTYDFIKRVLGEMKTKAEKSSSLEVEIAKLNQQLKDGTGDKKTLADLEAVQRAYKELEEKSKSEVETLKKASEQKEIRYELTSALSGFNFKKGITEPVRKAFVDQVINELTSIAEFREGKLVFLDKAGNPMRNAHNTLNPYTAKELLDERLKEIVDAGRVINNGPDIENEVIKEYDKTGKLIKAAIVVPDSVKTKVDLGEFLVKSKILRGTPEYNMLYAEYSKNLPIK